MPEPCHQTVWFKMQMAELATHLFCSFQSCRRDLESPPGCRAPRAAVLLEVDWSSADLMPTECFLLFQTAMQNILPSHCLSVLPPTSSRWLDPDVPHLAHFAVVFCFLIIQGYGLDVVSAALTAPLLWNKSLPALGIRISWGWFYCWA